MIAVSALAGLKIIEFFGISLASFQVGGGMLLLMSALQMLNAQPAESRKADLAEGDDKVDAGDSIAIVPLTIPLLTGPATISTMVIYAEKTRHWWELADPGRLRRRDRRWRSGSRSACPGRIARVLGRTGINVMTRLMGLILAALAVEVMSDGLTKLFPGAGAGTAADGLSERRRAYDYIVCGAGTAGCLLANRLSADRSKHVLLIEAGGNDDYLWVHIPVGYLYCIGNPRTDWLYATEPEAGLNGRSLRYPRGKVLGGSSSINGMIYMRGQARDYDGWGAGDGFGANPGWSWDDACRTSSSTRTSTAAPTPSMPRPASTRPASARAASGGSRSSACAGTSSTPSPPPRSRPASRAPTTSTAATTRASATSRSTSAPASAGTRPRRSCARSCAAPNLQVWTGAHIDRVVLDAEGRAERRRASRRLGGGRGRARHARARRRGDPRDRRDRHAADPAALRASARPALLQAHGIAVRRDARPASARTCRTTCRSARSSASRAPRP